jgi:hypothetical protein
MNAETLRLYRGRMAPLPWRTIASWGMALALVSSLFLTGSSLAGLRVRFLPALKNELRYPGADMVYFQGAGYLANEGQAKYIYVRPIPDEVRNSFPFEEGLRYPGGFAYTPLVAYAAAPLADEPQREATDKWQIAALVAIGVAAVCVASTFTSWHWRAAIVAAAFAWQPFLLSLRFSQTGVFIAAIAAVGYVLFFRYRPAGAGVLGLLILKPPLAIGPGLAMLGERWKVMLAFGVSVIAVGIVPLLLLGGLDAVRGWVDIILERSEIEITGGTGHKYSAGLSRSIDFSSPAGYALLAICGAAAAAVVIFVSKRLGSAEAAIVGVLGAMMLSPHSLFYDWAIVFVTILLVRKATSLGPLSTDLGAGAFALSLFLFGQWSWHLIDVKGDYLLHPLTFWSLAVCAGLLGLAVRRGGLPGKQFRISAFQRFRS